MYEGNLGEIGFGSSSREVRVIGSQLQIEGEGGGGGGLEAEVYGMLNRFSKI